jgi:hypothetical protein
MSETAVEQRTAQPEANGQEAATEERSDTVQQPKARSGYGRLGNRHHRLIAEYESLEAEFQALRLELAEWRGMYLQLKDDLAPLIEAKSND